MAIVYIPLVDPGTDGNIIPKLQDAYDLCNPLNYNIILLPPKYYYAYGTATNTCKNVELRCSTLAVNTWSDFTNDYLTGNPLTWSVVPQCVIRRNESTSDASLEAVSIIENIINSTSPCGIKISDIDFRSKIPSVNGNVTAGIPAADGLSLAVDYGIRFNGCVDYQVTRCKFSWFGDAAIIVKHDDYIVRGLIYKNHFEKNAKGVDGAGAGYGIAVSGLDLNYDTNAGFGTSNFNFFENNSSSMHRHWAAAGGCGRYNARHNYVENGGSVTNYSSSQSFDAHGGRFDTPGSGNYFPSRVISISNNKIITTKYYDGTPINNNNGHDLIERAIYTKECEARVYNNIIAGSRFSVAIGIENYGIISTAYPIPYTMGYESGISGGSGNPNGSAGDSYYWNNNCLVNDAGNGAGYAQAFYNFYPSNLLNGRDYHLTDPGETEYTYPHPLRDDLVVIPPIITTGIRTHQTRIFHTR
ncbi:MAG: hypothetical protein ABI241_00460 [Bacteroidia bacterium]